MPPEYQFLAYGDFTFFLDECETRVRRKQERDLAGLSYIDRVSIVRDDDLPDSLKPKKKGASKARADADSAWEKSSQGTSVGDDDEDADQGTGPRTSPRPSCARRRRRRRRRRAISPPFDGVCLMGLRIAAKKCKIPEESVSFLVEIDQLRQAATIAPTPRVPCPCLDFAWSRRPPLARRRFLSERHSTNSPCPKNPPRPRGDDSRGTADDRSPGWTTACWRRFADRSMRLRPPWLPRSRAEREELVCKQVVRSKQNSDAPKHRVVVLGGGFAGTILGATCAMTEGALSRHPD